jgi:hypothetical protein
VKDAVRDPKKFGASSFSTQPLNSPIGADKLFLLMVNRDNSVVAGKQISLEAEWYCVRVVITKL